VTSREGGKGVASMEMFFSSFRAYAKAQATETEGHLTRLETADKVSSYLCYFLQFYYFPGIPPRHGPAGWSRSGLRNKSSLSSFLLQTIVDWRTALYNRLVASYHKAKIERADMARELEAAKGEASSF
jgi:hypothetical protein